MSKISAPAPVIQPVRNTIAERERALGLPPLPATLGAAKMHPTRVQFAQGYFAQRGKLMTQYYSALHACPTNRAKCAELRAKIATLDAVVKTPAQVIVLDTIEIRGGK